MARIGYAKVGRSYNLNPEKATSIGGDIDVLHALVRLANRFPEHEFVLIGKNSGEDPREFGYPENIVNPWTEWKNDWTVVPDPSRADMMIEHARRLMGNAHETLDHFIVWAGQHGSANSRIPMIGNDWTTPPGYELIPGTDSYSNEFNDIITGGEAGELATPQFAFVHYVSWLCDFIARWREAGPGALYREEIWLCPDPRNYLKLREKRWPLRYPVIAQYDFYKYHKGERYGRFPPELARLDPTGYRENSLWVSNVAYSYGGLELTAVAAPEDVPFDPRPGEHLFGMVVNENLTGVKDARLALLKSWILPNFPEAEIRGHWTEKSQLNLQRVIEPVPYVDCARVMKSFKTTLTTPASGSEWATAKPWESFALGSVCFFHPRYDGQGHILPLKDGTAGHALVSEDSKMLAQFLRVNDEEQFVQRVNEVTSQPELYHTIVTAQRRHYEAAFNAWQGGISAIADRIQSDEDRITAGIELMERNGEEEPWLNYTVPPAAKVQSRSAPRPRGTNEERRKKKPPVSRRRALKSLENENVVDSVVDETAAVEALEPVSENVPKTSRIGFMPGISLGGFVNFGNIKTSFEIVPKATELVARPSKDEYFLNIAREVAKQTTCARRAVGCVVVNVNKKILATGYNGVPRGMPHCNEGNPCKGANMPSGQGLSDCLSVHAEINALVQCAAVEDIETIYLTVSPCRDCIKVIMNTGATRIVFAEEYVQHEARELWLSRPGNEWIKL